MCNYADTSPANHDLLAVLKGARNGLIYGVKIREYALRSADDRFPPCPCDDLFILPQTVSRSLDLAHP